MGTHRWSHQVTRRNVFSVRKLHPSVNDETLSIQRMKLIVDLVISVPWALYFWLAWKRKDPHCTRTGARRLSEGLSRPVCHGGWINP